MRALFASTVCVAALAGAGQARPATVTADTGARRCVSRAVVVRSSSEAVVTVEKHASGGDPLDGGTETRIWRACAEHVGTFFELERGATAYTGGHGARHFELAGDYVAFLAGDFNKYEADTSLSVVSLVTGQRWTSAVVNTINGDPGFTDLAVNRLGDAAWIRETYDGHGHDQWRIYLRRGDAVSLRYRSRLELTALRLDAGHLRFKEHGRARERRTNATSSILYAQGREPSGR